MIEKIKKYQSIFLILGCLPLAGVVFLSCYLVDTMSLITNIIVGVLAILQAVFLALAAMTA